METNTEGHLRAHVRVLTLLLAAALMCVVSPSGGAHSATPESTEGTVHTVSISVASNIGAVRVTDAQMIAAVSRAAQYWVRESDGRIARFDLVGPPVSFDSREALPGGGCGTGWNHNSPALYDSLADAYATVSPELRASPTHHTVVVIPVACKLGGGAYASTGEGLSSGGYVVVGGSSAMAGLLTHEFGHNLGLMHASSVYPRNNGTEATPYEYGSEYDPMGTGEGMETPTSPAATLNTVARKRLGLLGDGEVAEFNIGDGACGTTATYVLAPRSARTGLRSVSFGAQGLGSEHFVSFRSGTGDDAGTSYASGTTMKAGVGAVVETATENGGLLLRAATANRMNIKDDGVPWVRGSYRVRVLAHGPNRAYTVVQVTYEPDNGCQHGAPGVVWSTQTHVSATLTGTLASGKVTAAATFATPDGVALTLPAGGDVAYSWAAPRPATKKSALRTIARGETLRVKKLPRKVARLLARAKRGDGAPRVLISTRVNQVDSLGQPWALSLSGEQVLPSRTAGKRHKK